MSSYALIPCTIWLLVALPRFQAACPTCTICSQPTSVVYAGYTYRTLYNASLYGKGYTTDEEHTYFPMPVGFEVAPDDTDINDYVVAPFDWDAYRLCTQSKCVHGRYYGDDAGSISDDEIMWETDGNGNYRIKPSSSSYYRLLIREQACTPISTCTICSQPTSVAYAGYTYRTLYNASLNGKDYSNKIEQTYFPMPVGFEVAPDDSDIYDYVVAPFDWDIYRVCTQSKCGKGRYYGDDAGSNYDKDKWETDGNGNYRAKGGLFGLFDDNHRLLIRKANVCNCPNGTAQTTPDCNTDQATECSSCNPGYFGITCQANVCDCPNGVARIAPACTTDQATECSSCNPGYSGTTCQVACGPTADFVQTNIPGVQQNNTHGVLDSTMSNYIFAWIDGGYRKMVLANPMGMTLRAGYIISTATDWIDTDTWTDHSEYAISGFSNSCEVFGYLHYEKSCVIDENIRLYPQRTVGECALLCDADSSCKSFEYGVNHGGASTLYNAADCNLQSGANRDGCNGVHYNMDLYVKVAQACNEALSGDGSDYRGCQTTTRSGKTCQAWSAQSPHAHSRRVSNYPYSGLVSNYCRNPDGEPTIWCYTTDPYSRFEMCDPLQARINDFAASK